MSEADEFRQYAAQCLTCAHSATDSESRIAWLDMAQKWQRLAEKVGARPVPVTEHRPANTNKPE
jgi:hypothetical protein